MQYCSAVSGRIPPHCLVLPTVYRRRGRRGKALSGHPQSASHITGSLTHIFVPIHFAMSFCHHPMADVRVAVRGTLANDAVRPSPTRSTSSTLRWNHWGHQSTPLPRFNFACGYSTCALRPEPIVAGRRTTCHPMVPEPAHAEPLSEPNAPSQQKMPSIEPEPEPVPEPEPEPESGNRDEASQPQRRHQQRRLRSGFLSPSKRREEVPPPPFDRAEPSPRQGSTRPRVSSLVNVRAPSPSCRLTPHHLGDAWSLIAGRTGRVCVAGPNAEGHLSLQS